MSVPYKSVDESDYKTYLDYGVIPTVDGPIVIFQDKNIPEELKQRVIADVQKEWDEPLHPKSDKPWLEFR